MARRHQPAAAETLGEIESAADRLGQWLQENLRLVILAVVGVLAITGLGAWLVSAQERVEKEASAELAAVRADFLTAMGAGPGALEVPELANPETAAGIRSEYRERFDEVAARHRGTVAAALAGLESARLAAANGAPEEAIARLEETLEQAPAKDPLRGMILQQLAQQLEATGRWEEAARRHEQAAELGGYPARGWALADAARCAARAGDPERALALYERLDEEAPGLRLPDHQSAQLRELRSALD